MEGLKLFLLEFYLVFMKSDPVSCEKQSFTVAFMTNVASYGTCDDLSLFFAATETTNCSISVPKTSFQTRVFTVRNKNVVEEQLPRVYAMSGSGVEQKGIAVTCNNTIRLYGINSCKYTTDGFSVIPNSDLGREYYAFTVLPTEGYSQVAIVGYLDDTTVTVHLRCTNCIVIIDGINYASGEYISLVLDAYECLQIQSSGNLSGVYISSNNPVSVFSGNEMSKISTSYLEHLVIHVPPLKSWGKQYAVIPNQCDKLFLMASEHFTNVRITCSGGTLYQHILMAGDVIRQTIFQNKYCFIEANQSVLAVQTLKEEPSFLLVTPIDQYSFNYTFKVPNRYTNNYFFFVIKESAAPELMLDFQAIPINYIQIPGTNLVGGYLEVTANLHHVTHPYAHFNGMVVGFGDKESYAISLGWNWKTTHTLDTTNEGLTSIVQTTHQSLKASEKRDHSSTTSSETRDRSSTSATETSDQSSTSATETSDHSLTSASETRDNSLTSATQTSDQSSTLATDTSDQSSKSTTQTTDQSSTLASETRDQRSTSASDTHDQSTPSATETRDQSSTSASITSDQSSTLTTETRGQISTSSTNKIAHMLTTATGTRDKSFISDTETSNQSATSVTKTHDQSSTLAAVTRDQSSTSATETRDQSSTSSTKTTRHESSTSDTDTNDQRSTFTTKTRDQSSTLAEVTRNNSSTSATELRDQSSISSTETTRDGSSTSATETRYQSSTSSTKIRDPRLTSAATITDQKLTPSIESSTSALEIPYQSSGSPSEKTLSSTPPKESTYEKLSSQETHDYMTDLPNYNYFTTAATTPSQSTSDLSTPTLNNNCVNHTIIEQDCNCKCSCGTKETPWTGLLKSNIPKDELVKRVREDFERNIKGHIMINRQNVSRMVRMKTSVMNSEITAKYIGLGISWIVLVPIVFAVVSDFVNVVRNCCRRRSNNTPVL